VAQHVTELVHTHLVALAAVQERGAIAVGKKAETAAHDLGNSQNISAPAHLLYKSR